MNSKKKKELKQSKCLDVLEMSYVLENLYHRKELNNAKKKIKRDVTLKAISLFIRKETFCSTKTKNFDLNETPLIITAAATNCIYLVYHLVSLGEYVDVKSLSGCTPLFEAVKNGDSTMVYLLLSLGADPNQTNSYRTTSLMIAAFFGYHKIIQLLISWGANIEDRDVDGESALFCAIDGGNTQCILELIGCGADIDALNKKNESVLVKAIQKRNFMCVELLLEIGVVIESNVLDAVDPRKERFDQTTQKRVKQLIIDCQPMRRSLIVLSAKKIRTNPKRGLLTNQIPERLHFIVGCNKR